MLPDICYLRSINVTFVCFVVANETEDSEGKRPTRCLLDRARFLALDVSDSKGNYIPKCGKDGSYDPVQCHSASGQCWCVDKYGNELYETRQEGPPDCTNTG